MIEYSRRWSAMFLYPCGQMYYVWIYWCLYCFILYIIGPMVLKVQWQNCYKTLTLRPDNVLILAHNLVNLWYVVNLYCYMCKMYHQSYHSDVISYMSKALFDERKFILQYYMHGGCHGCGSSDAMLSNTISCVCFNNVNKNKMRYQAHFLFCAKPQWPLTCLLIDVM